MALVLRRGLLAGLIAGLVSGVYLLLVGEPVIDQAIRLEAAASGGAPAVEVFSRGTQRLGLVGATVLYGLAVGGVFAIIHRLLEPRMAAGTAWDKAVRLAAAGFGTLFLVPFLEYPSNPPGVGDPATAGTRTRLYLAAIALSAVISLLAWLAARRLAELGVERWGGPRGPRGGGRGGGRESAPGTWSRSASPTPSCPRCRSRSTCRPRSFGKRGWRRRRGRRCCGPASVRRSARSGCAPNARRPAPRQRPPAPDLGA
jgi:hypothetical protein